MEGQPLEEMGELGWTGSQAGGGQTRGDTHTHTWESGPRAGAQTSEVHASPRATPPSPAWTMMKSNSEQSVLCQPGRVHKGHSIKICWRIDFQAQLLLTSSGPTRMYNWKPPLEPTSSQRPPTRLLVWVAP